MNAPAPLLDVRVRAMRLQTDDIVSCELEAFDGAPLPPAAPGAHVDLHLPGGLVRPYSIAINAGGRYTVAVRREAASRGGSRFVCDELRIGQKLTISTPRDNFPLDRNAREVLLIAGGIGLTPLLAMARARAAANRNWVLHLVVRDTASVPFADELAALGDNVHIHVTQGGGRPDLATLVAAAPPDAELYCCGPAAMLDAFARATAAMSGRTHVERFEAAEPRANDGALTVQLARSHKTLVVRREQTILEALLDADVPVDYSCQTGICGSCETRVLAGVPDHRDEVLTETERRSNKSMMVCCSRAMGDNLTLDL